MCIFKLCAAISQDFGLLEIGPLYCKHTQLNLCEKEELPCFLYLIQTFVFGPSFLGFLIVSWCKKQKKVSIWLFWAYISSAGLTIVYQPAAIVNVPKKALLQERWSPINLMNCLIITFEKVQPLSKLFYICPAVSYLYYWNSQYSHFG